MAKKPRQERERQKERSRVRETRRGDRGESEEKGKQRGRERRSASGFFFGSNQERTKSRATVPRVRDRSNFFFSTLRYTDTRSHAYHAHAVASRRPRSRLNQEHLELGIAFANEIRHAPRAFNLYTVCRLYTVARNSSQPNLFIPRKRRVVSIRGVLLSADDHRQTSSA